MSADEAGEHVLQGRWRLIKTDWPYAFISVTAKDHQEYVLRLDCGGYPQAPPTGQSGRRSLRSLRTPSRLQYPSSLPIYCPVKSGALNREADDRKTGHCHGI